MARFARAVELRHFILPKGCYVNYDLKLIEFLKSLDGDGAAKDYEALKKTLGHRPTLTEFYRSGASIPAMRKQFGNWFGLVKEMGDLESSETQAFAEHSEFLREIETTSMTRSFKMVLLDPVWVAYWRNNPINAWVGGNRVASARSFFSVIDQRFVPAFTLEESNYEAFQSMVQELLDYRLTAYESRRVSTGATENVIQFPH